MLCKPIIDRLREEIAHRKEGLSGPAADEDRLLADALYHIEKQEHALKVAAERFEDLGQIISRDGHYDNSGFMHASAALPRTRLLRNVG